jgi:D-alanyl-D-alanine carboxypeptidase/D-alanyl-D-alanine-endopeptidase (penicillin-binding protein 4)
MAVQSTAFPDRQRTPHRRSRWFASALALSLATPLVSAADLAATVKGLVNGGSPKKGVTCVSIRGEDGGELVRINGDTPVMPASNEKLITTGSALRILGADFVFQTRLLRDGDRLIAVGDGDPAFADPELLSQMVYTDAAGQQQHGMTPEALLDLWVQGVKASGMTECAELVVDDRVFDRSGVHPGWPADQLNEHYCAPVAGLTFHLNRQDFWTRPTERGAEISRTRPSADFLSIVNHTKRVKGSDNAIWIQREAVANTFTIRGACAKPLEEPVSVALAEPSSYFGQLLAERLAKGGVAVKKVRLAGSEDPPSKGDVVGPVIRTPIATVLTRCNVDSQNLYAECLIKRIGFATTGTSGTWLNGTDAAEKLVRQRLGATVKTDALDAVDGSGLSKENRVTASLLSAWVTDLANDPAVGQTFVSSLAVGGKSGTVRKRFHDLDARKFTVHCKTGYIDGVCALSGIVECVNGHRAAFSVICNGFEPGGVGKAKQLQESVVKATADYLDRLVPANAAVSSRVRDALGGG